MPKTEFLQNCKEKSGNANFNFEFFFKMASFVKWLMGTKLCLPICAFAFSCTSIYPLRWSLQLFQSFRRDQSSLELSPHGVGETSMQNIVVVTTWWNEGTTSSVCKDSLVTFMAIGQLRRPDKSITIEYVIQKLYACLNWGGIASKNRSEW